ncbi:MAG: hypothetical protein CL946_06275 [Ectothiorhodospiraceae bacterium]|nr:hypothetical protein [Ectothiorhodospiraceae bacterium]
MPAKKNIVPIPATSDQLNLIRRLLPPDSKAINTVQSHKDAEDFIRELEANRDEPIATNAQVNYLLILGARQNEVERISKDEAKELIERLRRQPSEKQRQYLFRLGYTKAQVDSLTRDDATRLISSLVNKQTQGGSTPNLRLVGGDE